MSILSEAITFYKERKKEERERKALLSAKSDFALLEKLVKKCNDNPNLKIEIFLTDGTRILLRSYEDAQRRDFEMINGVSFEEVR